MSITDAVLLAGGSGTRFLDARIQNPIGAEAKDSRALPKQFQTLGDAPVFVHSLKALLSITPLRQVVIAMPESHVHLAREIVQKQFSGIATVIQVVPGGTRRQDSTRLALEAIQALSPEPARVLIHDACRPNLRPNFLARIRDHLLDRAYGAWIPVVPSTDTLKRVANQRVVETLDRSTIGCVQTPQIFEFPVIRLLSERANQLPDIAFTDDASLCEYFGIPVGVFDGDPENLKLTYPFETVALEALLNAHGKETACASELDMTSTASYPV